MIGLEIEMNHHILEIIMIKISVLMIEIVINQIITIEKNIIIGITIDNFFTESSNEFFFLIILIYIVI